MKMQKSYLYDYLYCSAVILLAFLFIIPSIKLHKYKEYVAQTILDYKSLKKIIKPNSGLEVLPNEVQIALKGIKEKKINEYAIVGTFRKNDLLYQRLSEAAWPARNTSSVRVIIGYSKDIYSFSNYSVIWQDQGIAIANLHK